MHKHGFSGPRGEIHRLTHVSTVLEGNPWNDPVERQLDVYTPPGYDPKRATRYPLLVDLTGYFGSGPAHSAFKTLGENVPERVDRLIHEGRMKPAVVAFPNCFTWLGGNQYINSASVGRYADYLIQEIVPFVEGHFHAGGDRGLRACFGKSSGGYGSVYHGMVHADFWGAAASHSGDMAWDYVYRTEFPNLLNELAKHDRDPVKLVEDYWAEKKPPQKAGMALMMVCMAATYDGNEESPRDIRVPFTNLESGVVDEEAWARWLKYDPVVMVEDHVEALKSLKLFFVDCGWKDQFHIHYGARQFRDRCRDLGIPLHYEEFEDDHSSVDYRMDVSLPMLVDALDS